LGQTFRHSRNPCRPKQNFSPAGLPGTDEPVVLQPALGLHGVGLYRQGGKDPKAMDPTTYLRERFTPSAVFHRGMEKLKVVASGGQSKHLKQEMQSCWRYCRGESAGMAPMEHSLTHFMHWTQASLTERLTIRRREAREKSVPRGRGSGTRTSCGSPQRQDPTKKRKISRLTLKTGGFMADRMKGLLGRNAGPREESSYRGRRQGGRSDDQRPGDEAEGIEKIKNWSPIKPVARAKINTP